MIKTSIYKSIPELMLVGVCLLSSVTVSAEYLNPYDKSPPFEMSVHEQIRFEEIGRRAQCLRIDRVRNSSSAELQRTFHDKIHGCLKGKLRVSGDIPNNAKYGVFAQQRDLDVWMRLSNINKHDDDKRDLRGMAIKIVDPNHRMSDPPVGQDFLVNDTKRHFASTPEDILEFVEYSAQGRRLRYIAKHPIRFVDIVKNQSAKPYSLLNREYHSRAPFHLGGPVIKDQTKIKYAIVPCHENGQHPKRRSSNHLTEDLIQNAASAEPICFNFVVQFFENEETTPLTDYTVEWQSTHHTLGQLIFEKQIILSAGDVLGKDFVTTCGDLSFDPWNSLLAHRPVGDVNKARWYIYRTSRNQEPEETLRCD